MAVLLPDRLLGVRHRAAPSVDGHGDRSAPSWGGIVGPWPGRAAEGPDVPVGDVGGRSWIIALDSAAWPVLQGDLVAEPASAREWLVNSADLLSNNADASIDYIRVEAHIRVVNSTAP